VVQEKLQILQAAFELRHANQPWQFHNSGILASMWKRAFRLQLEGKFFCKCFNALFLNYFGQGLTLQQQLNND
jgi:hypothetical protein